MLFKCLFHRVLWLFLWCTSFPNRKVQMNEFLPSCCLPDQHQRPWTWFWWRRNQSRSKRTWQVGWLNIHLTDWKQSSVTISFFGDLVSSNVPHTSILSTFHFLFSNHIFCCSSFPKRSLLFLPTSKFYIWTSGPSVFEINLAAAACSSTWWPAACDVRPVTFASFIFQQTRDHGGHLTASRAHMEGAGSKSCACV